MGKKKAKEKSSKDNDDFTVPSCTHIRKGIDQSLLKKTLQDMVWTTCQDCKDEGPLSVEEANMAGLAVWVCLKCGHRGCGRDSESQHAIRHYEKPHSDTHCLVLSVDNWSVWCYICDDEVQYSSTGQLAQLVSGIKKQAQSEPRRRTATPRKLNEEDKQEEAPRKQNRDVPKNHPRQENGVSEGQKASSAESNSISPAVSVRGLSNLGNTCFFNAVVQNLSQTQLLRQVLNDVCGEKGSHTLTLDVNKELEPILIQLDQPGSLTLAMCSLLNEIQETKKGVVTPKELFTQVCKKAARFKGFQQQDSQELLRYLLDGMRAEEIKRVSLGILEALKNSGKDTGTEESNKLIKEYEKIGARRNFVDQVFGGEMTSTVMCKECKTVSLVTEMFLDLSLPVSDEAFRKKNHQKKGGHKGSKVDNGGQDTPSSLTNGNVDGLSGEGSKYQQKKAKKQAKKQAKNQRRQQKQVGKVVDGGTADVGSEGPEEEEETVLEPGAEAEMQGAEGGLAGEDGSLVPSRRQEDRDGGLEEGEERANPKSSVTTTVVLTPLSDDQNAEEEKEEEEDEEEKLAGDKASKEEDELVEDLQCLSLNTAFVAPEDVQLDLVSGEAPVDLREYTVVHRDPELAFHTLANRAAPEKQECSLTSCLYQFTEVENLTKNNSLLCVNCTQKQPNTKALDGSRKSVYTDALKQMLISSPPPVLTLHLKRFQQVGYSVCKVNRHVHFPQILDLAPFCSVSCKNVTEGSTQVLYSLYGIVEHSGTMRSGHYTAFVKARQSCLATPLNGLTAPGGGAEPTKGVWYYVSDSSVQPISDAKVQTSQAYLLFYERIS